MSKTTQTLDRTRASADAVAPSPETREQMREDFARERLPESRRRGSGTVLMVLVGIITAFFFTTTGGTYVLTYGAKATFIGLAVAFVVITALTLVTASAASREGLNSDLLTRGCGYGYAGSAVTALIYAATFVIYAALEGQILASAVHQLWALPIDVWYVVVGLIFIPLTWYGMAQLSWTMWLTFPVYLVLIVVAVIKALNRAGGFPSHFWNAAPPHSILGGLGIVGVMAGLAGTVGLNPLEFSDYTRFIAPGRFRRAAFTSVILPYALMFFVAFPLGVFFTLTTGQTNPGVYFVSLLGLGLGVLFAWVTQVRINLTNVYSGSMALSNFVSRTTGWRPSRIVWVAVIAVASVGLMFANILAHLLSFLEWDGIFLLSWVGTVVADLVIVKRLLKLGPPTLEYERSRLWLINPVGPVALIVAVGIGSLLHYGVSNEYISELSAYIAFLVAVVVHVAMAIATKGRYYVKPDLAEPARPAQRIPAGKV